MGKIYLTGDCHADFHRFSSSDFTAQKSLMRDDFVIVLGDFGIWHDSAEERFWLDWLSEKNFTTLFLDGNHENFDRLYGEEFPSVPFHGGQAHKIRENLFHLKRGYIFSLCGKDFFVFGGAKSHDIKDGVLDPGAYPSKSAFVRDYNRMKKAGKFVRINHISWWEQELPTEEEMQFGLDTLSAHHNRVDYILTHCCPQSVSSYMGYHDSNPLTFYFDQISQTASFSHWYFGHYHKDDLDVLYNKLSVLYRRIIRIV